MAAKDLHLKKLQCESIFGKFEYVPGRFLVCSTISYLFILCKRQGYAFRTLIEDTLRNLTEHSAVCSNY